MTPPPRLSSTSTRRKRMADMSAVVLVSKFKDALCAGKQMADAENWADAAMRNGMIAHFLIAVSAIVEVFAPTIHVGATDATSIATGISAAIGVYFSWRSQRQHIASNPNAGLPRRK